MKFWLAKTGEVSLREQLAAQIILGITSRDLSPGERLPSTRELARRYGIHANTVSAAYRDLARRGWVTLRPGSGIYVRPDPPANGDAESVGLDQMISTFVAQARDAGFVAEQIRAGVERALAAPEPDHFLIIEPDPALREILLVEIKSAIGCAVRASHPTRLNSSVLARAAPVALNDELESVRSHLPANAECVGLRLTSIPGAMRGARRPSPEAILAIVSKWPEFLRWARTILLAAGIDAAAIMTRDARRTNWERGLDSAAMLICDQVTALRLGKDPRIRVFRVIADDSLKELGLIAGRFGSAQAKGN